MNITTVSYSAINTIIEISASKIRSENLISGEQRLDKILESFDFMLRELTVSISELTSKLNEAHIKLDETYYRRGVSY